MLDVYKEKRTRINVALWAYAYEIEAESIVSDAMFDMVCREINPAINTDRPDIDMFFRTEFDPSTGLWIYNHPDLEGIKKLYERVKNTLKKT